MPVSTPDRAVFPSSCQTLVRVVFILLASCAASPGNETGLPGLPNDNGSQAVAPLPTEVGPGDPRLCYSGRFDFSHPQTAVCAWSACAVSIRFQGTRANVALGTGANFFEVIVDGVPTKTISAGTFEAGTPPARVYAAASGLSAGEHRITVFKRTEANQGDAAFVAFQLDADATVLKAQPPARKIKVIGDSISCGYGNEGKNQDEHFSAATENAYLTYGALAARALGADYECIAWSGRKLWPTSTLPEIYDRILPREPSSRWNGDGHPPDVLLVNLCTNDFAAKELPDRARWVKAYRDFLARLRQEAPQATLYCAIGPMVKDGYPAGRPSHALASEWIKQVVAESNAAGDARVRYLEFERQRMADGIGSDWHPSVRTHEIMATQLVSALRADLHW